MARDYFLTSQRNQITSPSPRLIMTLNLHYPGSMPGPQCFHCAKPVFLR